jgi:ABC-type Na+ efflux pump permease subunit
VAVDLSVDERAAEPLDATDEAGVAPFTQIRLMAGLTLRDLLRRPGGWVATLLTAMLFAGLIGAVGLSAANTQTKIDSRSFAVAIGGDVDGAAQTIAALEADPRLAIRAVDDVAREVTEGRASSGVIFPADTDARLAAGEQVELRTFDRQSNATSTESFNSLALRLQQIELARAQGEQTAGPGPTVDIVELERDQGVARLEFARQVAPVGALLCIGIVTAVAAVFGAARERRSIEPLLVLPFRRDAIAAGIGTGAYPLGVLQLVIGVALLVATVAIPGSSLHQPPEVLLAMFVGGALASIPLALVATAFGCLAGSLGTGSDDAVSMGDLVSIVFVVVGVVAYLQSGIDAVFAYAIPVLGQVLLVRDAVDGSVGPLPALIAIVVAVALFVLVVRTAGRRLGDDRRLSRVPA